jgi:dTDP-4-dehydrorhamnose reductase
MDKIMILGSEGQIGWELQRSLASIGTLKCFNHQTLNLADKDAVRAAIKAYKPDDT